jgi:hypothetical protein
VPPATPEAAPAAPAPAEPEEQPIGMVDTSAVFLDDITRATVAEAPPAEAQPHEPETVLTAPPGNATPAAAAADPFLAETLAIGDRETEKEPGPGDTLVEPPMAGRDEVKRPELPETVVVDRTELLPSAELVWEEGPTAQIQVPSKAGGRAGTGAPKGDLAETVAMPESTELERTERMEPLPAEPSEKEREDQLASIPDHVLTPTLADIYYHQGQPKLAVQIYKRLLQLHPANTRIAERVAEIEASIAAQSQAAPAAPAPAAAPARVRRGRRKPKPRPPRPLAGVRIKKAYRERYFRRKHGLRP